MKVDNDFVLNTLFKEHLNKFNVKNGQELIFLDDVKNFIEKKSYFELQYASVFFFFLKKIKLLPYFKLSIYRL